MYVSIQIHFIIKKKVHYGYGAMLSRGGFRIVHGKVHPPSYGRQMIAVPRAFGSSHYGLNHAFLRHIMLG